MALRFGKKILLCFPSLYYRKSNIFNSIERRLVFPEILENEFEIENFIRVRDEWNVSYTFLYCRKKSRKKENGHGTDRCLENVPEGVVGW